MEEVSLYVSIVISALNMVYILYKNTINPGEIYKYVLILLLLLVINVIKKIINDKNNYVKLISIFQCALIIFFINRGFVYSILLFPVYEFDLLYNIKNLYIKFVLVVSLLLPWVNTHFFIEYFIYNLLILAYLFHVYILNDKIRKLKNSNRNVRDSEFTMKKKIIDLDRYLDQNQMLTSLKERNYISQKLHDKLGHRITSSLMQLEVTKETLNTDKDLSTKYLESAMSNLRDGMEEIRAFLRNIKPKDKLISIEDIKEIIYKFQYVSGIKTVLKITGSIEKVNYDLLYAIEDNIQEALTNAGKYSKATEIRININIYNKLLRVEVRDNGVGCKKVKYGLGLDGIEKRLKPYKGRIDYYNDNGFVLNMIAEF